MPRRRLSKPNWNDSELRRDKRPTLNNTPSPAIAMSLSLNTFRTPLGWCAMLGDGETLYALTFGHRGVEAAVKWLDRQLPEPSAADARGAKWNPRLAKRIAAVLDGEPDEF